MVHNSTAHQHLIVLAGMGAVFSTRQEKRR